MSKGIIKALVDRKQSVAGLEIYETDYYFGYYEFDSYFSEEEQKLVVYIDLTCIGEDTVNKLETIKSTKWLVVEQEILYTRLKAFIKDIQNGKLKSIKNKESIFIEKYLENKDKSDIPLYSFLESDDIKQKDRSQVTISATNFENIIGSSIYYVIPMNFYPELTNLKERFPRFKYSNSKIITFACFIIDGVNELEKDKIFHFGEVVTLLLVVDNFNRIKPQIFHGDEDRERKIVFINEIYYLDKSNKEIIVKEWEKIFLEKNIDKKVAETGKEINRNQNYREKLVIDPEWFPAEIRRQYETLEVFYRVKIKRKSNRFKEEKFDSKIDYNKNAKYEVFDFSTKENELGEYAKVKYHNMGSIIIDMLTLEEVLERNESRKNEMMQYVGDTEFSEVGNHPCRFEKILIKNGKRESYIFDEKKEKTEKVDETNFVFGIVANEEAKGVSILLEGVVIEKCNGNGLKKPNKHTKVSNIFNLESEGILTENSGIKNKKENIKFSDVQGLIKDKDYSYTGINQLNLYLKYQYVKVFMEQNSHELSNITDSLWICNYFFLDEKMAQNYFVPISICRYPTQRANIRVYPDITWGVSFSIGKAGAKYKEEWKNKVDENRRELLRETDEYIKNNKFLNALNNLSVGNKKKNKLDFKLGINVSYSKQRYDFTTNLGGPIYNILYSFSILKETLDAVFGNDDNSDSDEVRANKYQKKLAKNPSFKKFAKLPISIIIGNPVISGGFAWGFKESKEDGRVSNNYDVYLKASPLFSATGTLDLLVMAEYIPVFGQAIKVVDIVLGAGGITPAFFIQATGSLEFGFNIVNYKRTIDYNQRVKIEKNRDFDLGLTGTFKVIVEASITLSGSSMVGFLFTGGLDVAYKGKGEAGVIGKASVGVDEKGLYINGEIVFSGINFVAQKVVEDKKSGGTRIKTIGPYTVVKKKDLFKGKYYLR